MGDINTLVNIITDWIYCRYAQNPKHHVSFILKLEHSMPSNELGVG